MAAGLLLSTTYELPILRYSLAVALLVVLVIFRKKIAGYVKQLMAMRQSNKENSE